MIEQQLTSLLTAVHAKVYPITAPKGASPPFLTYQRASTIRYQDLAGKTDLATATFRVDVYHPSFLAVRELANRIRVALDGFISSDVAITLEQERDLSDLEGEPALYRVNLEFAVTYREATTNPV